MLAIPSVEDEQQPASQAHPTDNKVSLKPAQGTKTRMSEHIESSTCPWRVGKARS